ncbi:MAG: VIT domain-containing protein [bacterium]
MKNLKPFALCLLAFYIIFSSICSSYADGILIPIIPEVQISIKYHIVKVNIDNQIATTSVDQIFVNNSPMQVEATYIFPLPEGVAISEFIMYDESGKPLKAELLDSTKARNIYEEIVRQRKDPAILEYLGTGAFRARIFPIMPWSEKRIQLEYSEILTYDSGICRYRYPLNTEKFSSKPLEKVQVEVKLKSNSPIKSIWSPTHEGKIVVKREGENFANILYADEYIKPDKDFALYYTVSDEDIGLNLITYKESSEDGFFVLMMAPKQNISTNEIISKNVIFVFDTSGSMAVENKIGQTREALEFCVRKLNKQDTFNIIDFSTSVRKFKPSPVSAGTAEIQDALKYISKLEATGGTNINSALLEALRQIENAKKSFNIIVFLTDGQPTVDVQDENIILKNVKTANKNNTRIFVFGVGYDVNTKFLDGLASDNRGVSVYVRPNEKIEIIISDFFAKVSIPILSDPKVDFGSINVYDVYPPSLPDLFAGTQLRIFGRYRNSGNTTLRLVGISNGKVVEFTYQASFPTIDVFNKFIPRIWAARKVGYLIDQIRMYGESPELIDEIKELSIKYGIVNEYISMLILEDEPISPGGLERQFVDITGKGAVDASIRLQETKNTEVAQSGSQGENVKIVEGKIFLKKDETWIDAESKDKKPTITLQYLSKAYFNTLSLYPEISKYLALGKDVVFYHNGEIYKIQDNPTNVIEGDLDGNGEVNMVDLVIVARSLGTDNVNADINGDGIVNILDLIMVANRLGKRN